jgi:hypothetical protein
VLRLLRRKPRTFDIQVQDLVLRVSVGTDLNEESRAAALSFWEQLHAYALRNPEVGTSKRPIEVGADAPAIVREMVEAAAAAGVGPMYSFQGALTDHVGRFLARQVSEVTVACGADLFIVARKRQKLVVHRRESGWAVSLVIEPRPEGVGVSTTLGHRQVGVDALAIVARSCMLADAAAAGVRAILPKEDGFRQALAYLRRVPGVEGGMLVQGDRVGVAGGVEIVT